jgi:hypothetical protein
MPRANIGTRSRKIGFKGFAAPRAEPKRRAFDAQNLESAKAVLENIESCGGETGGLVIWARTILAKSEGHPCAL